MKVCLTIPPSGFLIDERVFPSLGVLKVAAALEAAGVPVHVHDLSGRADVEGEVLVHLLGCVADAFGVTATMPQMPAAAAVARTIRSARPDARLILGGPHPTLLQASARNGVARAAGPLGELLALFDVVVAGDGERAVLEALAPGAPRLIDADDPRCPLWLAPADLDAAPLPARHLIDIASYRYQIDSVQTQSLIAQLGCPFGCTFCGGRQSPFLRRVRLRGTSSVLAEMRHLFEAYGTRGFMFLDDELNVNPAWPGLLRGIIDLQRELGVEFRLRGLLKSELLTDEQAGLMYEAGFRQVLVGFESGDERILQNIQKRATVADNTRCVETLRRHGIRVKALMSIGHAGETLATVQATERWLMDVRPDDFDCTIITVYPGTPYYDRAQLTAPGAWTYTAKNGDRLHAAEVDHLRDVNFYKGLPGAYRSYVWTDALSSSDLTWLRDAVECKVRRQLSIPWPTTSAEHDYEHSMGMSQAVA